MSPTEARVPADTVLARIAWLSARDPSRRFGNVMHLFHEQALAACFHALDGRKAVGADGVTKAEYGADLERNLVELVDRMKHLSYRPGPVREVRIAKAGAAGATRALGISSVEDKVVQGMVRKVLEAVYEPLFLDCSYGFRPGRGAHDAVRALHQYLYRHEVESVIDVDIARYFDTIDRRALLALVSQKVTDRRFLRYLGRLLKAGVLREGELKVGEEGVVQGSACSPVLANLYAHYALDEWFERTVKGCCRGEVAMFRYCDDVVICCQHGRDAERIRKALAGRLARFGLSLNEAKTRLVAFHRPGREEHGRREVFDFLGFTFYWGRSRRGVPLVKVKTSSKRLRAKVRAITDWVKCTRSLLPTQQLWAMLCAKVRGHIRYFGVSFNVRRVAAFVHHVRAIAYKWLNRRSGHRSFTWESFARFLQANPLPRTAVHHRLF